VAARQYQERALQAIESHLGPDDVGVAPPLNPDFRGAKNNQPFLAPAGVKDTRR